MVLMLMRGAAAGFAATIPMTVAMLALHRVLPRERQMDLAPKEVADGVVEAAGLDEVVSEDSLPIFEISAHFAYGTAAGLVYHMLLRWRWLARPAFGMIFGFLVWAGSYLGYLPALGIRRSATKDPAERTITMIVAHLVWGACLGLLTPLAPQRTASR
jgi:hypothetical protein